MAASHGEHQTNEQHEYSEEDRDLHDDFSYDYDDEPDAPTGEVEYRTGVQGDVDRRSGSMDRAGVLAAIGYRPDSQWKTPAASSGDESCDRCGRKVYPVERVDIGVIYHRGCFRWVVMMLIGGACTIALIYAHTYTQSDFARARIHTNAYRHTRMHTRTHARTHAHSLTHFTRR